jgi:hypothetical protein
MARVHAVTAHASPLTLPGNTQLSVTPAHRAHHDSSASLVGAIKGEDLTDDSVFGVATPTVSKNLSINGHLGQQ